MESIQKKVFVAVFLSIFFMGLAHAAPGTIDSISGTLSSGSTVTLDGSGFTAKTNVQPLFYWKADDGLEPSALGRKSSWDGSFNGELVSRGDDGVVIADGSEKSVRLDFGQSSGAILAKVSFDADQLYIWRKRYDDFDGDYAYAIRTRLVNVTSLEAGSVFENGVIMATADKSVVGRSMDVSLSGTSATVYYERDYGNINDVSFAKSNVNNGDKLYFYAATDTDLLTPIFEAESNEGYGVFYTFNHKTIRFWGKYSSERNTSYIALGDGVDSPITLRSVVVNENTQTGTFWGNSWDKMLDHAVQRWVNEEYQYKVSDIDVENGELFYWQNGEKGWSDKKFRFRTSDYPVKYSDVFMGQVSNGAQLGSYAYYDSLYIDDTWHRVIICENAVYENCKNREIQVPLTWTDTELSFKLNVAAFDDANSLYVYVVNSDGEVNSSGFALCRKCAEAPPGFRSEQQVH